MLPASNELGAVLEMFSIAGSTVVFALPQLELGVQSAPGVGGELPPLGSTAA